ncbi:Gfo/Idh/MocA family protein [Angustibacter luteus]|uniref:Gfo/Idh/MocA family protein n=1 Tax=Angustibacter luteus TaxID=658456 RepID=A0ABW1JAP0_9ACTN
MVGYSFMGAAHSQAWRNAGAFFDLPLLPAMNVLSGRDTAAAGAVARRFGWGDVVGDWKELLVRDDVQLVDVCTPGDTHAEISIAALEAGKHVLCEKPLANSVAEAEAMVAAAESAAAQGVRSMVGFTYRRVPAIALARRLVQQGRLGTIRHVRAQYLQDWLADPASPLTWRLQRERAGSGALGDIGAHIVDLVQHITGLTVGSVTAATETFVTERPLPIESAGLGGRGGDEMGAVTVDDAAVFLARFAGTAHPGALGVFEATRFANGRKNAIRIEVNGSDGSLAFDFESMNELSFHDATLDAETAGFRRILVTEPQHPYVGGWWPAGHGLGYEHAFTHQVVDLMNDLAGGREPAPSFADGLQVQRVLAAVEASAGSGAWQHV